MRKIILECFLAPGDIVMMTAAVRDLHRCYPGQFVTDVRTRCPELWENNPYLTPLSDNDPNAEYIHCDYPLINRANYAPYHCLHGFIEFLNERLGLAIRPTLFRGDIHLSEQEKLWYSQVHEKAGRPIPFWIVAAGGKFDVTIKWWATARYQAVVDAFRGRIQFVQIGQPGGHHPRLDGVIDLRGKTTLRELVRLVYHAQGVLCPVTSLMHLAAAVETPPGQPPSRACVVVAGGREPAHWEAYPEHQFIHSNGALSCCAQGGCWRDRTFRLRDGDKRDKEENLCLQPVEHLPRCMRLITPEEVVRRIELYFQSGRLRYLTRRERQAGERAVAVASRNKFDLQSLTLSSAGMACDQFIKTIPPWPGGFAGRGIVICGGGPTYFTGAWVCVHMLRRVGCRLPVQVWHLGPREMDQAMVNLLAPLGVECVDALKLRKLRPARILNGWPLKTYSIIHSPFREVLLLDADNVAVRDPEYLFETERFKQTGAIFWPDYRRVRGSKAREIWQSCGMRIPGEQEFESGQVLVDKQRCWSALNLAMWFNENCDFYYRYVHGDKETFHLAWRKTNTNYVLVPRRIHTLPETMCQHDLEGRRIFQHRNMDKWDILLQNKRVPDFWFEKECREDIARLRQLWDGGLGLASASRPGNRARNGSLQHPQLKSSAQMRNGQRLNGESKRISIAAVMISCPERNRMRRETLYRLSRTDWAGHPVHVQMDDGDGDNHQRQTRCAYRALEAGLASQAEYVLFLEDDLDFNLHLLHNLHHWGPVKDRDLAMASLYNPSVREFACDMKNRARLVSAGAVFGSQAFLLSREAVAHVLDRWHRVEGCQDKKISRLAERLGKPILYHSPSLVQHVGRTSVGGGTFHQAWDFDLNWKSGSRRWNHH